MPVARVGGRVITFRDPLLFGQHAEAGGDLIDESQTEICALIKDVGLRMARILAGGFTSISESGGRKRVAGQHGWAELQKHLRPEARAFCLSEQRWDGGVAAALAPESVADWLDRIRATKRLRDVAVGMRGFFLADPRDLSLLALADQFAENGVPGGEKMFRIVGGNDRLPARLASPLQSRMHLETTLLRVRHAAAGITATLERRGTRHELRADYLVCAMPATTLRDVVFEPAMPEPQQRAIAVLRYGDATKTALQFERATWRRRGKPARIRNSSADRRGVGWQRRTTANGIAAFRPPAWHPVAACRRRRERGYPRIAGEWRSVAHCSRAHVARPRKDEADRVVVADLGTRAVVQRWIRVLRSTVPAGTPHRVGAASRTSVLCGGTYEPSLAGIHERSRGDRPARFGRSGFSRES